MQPGQLIDQRYELLTLLGQGGQALVYRVRHRTLGTVHALKIVQHTSSSVRARLLEEGRVQASLRHPNVVNVTDVVEVDGQPGLIMEFVEGPPLNVLLERHRLTLDQVEPLASGLLEGVAYAHRKGFVHRDLKPHNVLCAMQEDGELVPKILDFGLVKALGQDSAAGRTRTGQFMGTPHYMAPEQIRNTKGVDKRADVWALGVILYQMVTGVLPFEGEDTFEIFAAITSGRYVPPRQLVPLPDTVADTIELALRVDQEARADSCERLLRAWRGEIEPTESHPPAPRRGSGRWAAVDLASFKQETLARGVDDQGGLSTLTLDSALSDPGAKSEPSGEFSSPTLAPAPGDVTTAYHPMDRIREAMRAAGASQEPPPAPVAISLTDSLTGEFARRRVPLWLSLLIALLMGVGGVLAAIVLGLGLTGLGGLGLGSAMPETATREPPPVISQVPPIDVEDEVVDARVGSPVDVVPPDPEPVPEPHPAPVQPSPTPKPDPAPQPAPPVAPAPLPEPVVAPAPEPPPAPAPVAAPTTARVTLSDSGDVDTAILKGGGRSFSLTKGASKELPPGTYSVKIIQDGVARDAPSVAVVAGEPISLVCAFSSTSCKRVLAP